MMHKLSLVVAVVWPRLGVAAELERAERPFRVAAVKTMRPDPISTLRRSAMLRASRGVSRPGGIGYRTGGDDLSGHGFGGRDSDRNVAALPGTGDWLRAGGPDRGGRHAGVFPSGAHPSAGRRHLNAAALYRIFSEIRQAGRGAHRSLSSRWKSQGSSICRFSTPIMPGICTRAAGRASGQASRASRSLLMFTTSIWRAMAAKVVMSRSTRRRSPFCKWDRIWFAAKCRRWRCGAVGSNPKAERVQLRLLRSHLALWRGEASEFLNYGRRVASPPLAVPALEMVFAEKDDTHTPANGAGGAARQVAVDERSDGHRLRLHR